MMLLSYQRDIPKHFPNLSVIRKKIRTIDELTG